jgi:hypothetical protein
VTATGNEHVRLRLGDIGWLRSSVEIGITIHNSCSRGGGGVPDIKYWKRDDGGGSYTCDGTSRGRLRNKQVFAIV